MMRSIKSILSTDRERYKVPRKVQDVIPIRRIWPDGISLVGNKFVKLFGHRERRSIMCRS